MSIFPSPELVALTQPTIPDLSAQDFTAYIARIGKVKQNPAKLLRYLIEHAHWSPFEHTFATFKIETSRAIGRELLRHRSFTFQELSQRYEKAPGFCSIELRQQSLQNRQSSTHIFDPEIDGESASILIAKHQTETLALYQKLLNAGVARECARFILPESTSTVILMSGPLRSWIHFFAVRDHQDAQKEIRILAKAIKAIFIEQFPIISEAAFGKMDMNEVAAIQQTTV